MEFGLSLFRIKARLTVFLIDRPIESEANDEIAKEEGVQKLREKPSIQ
jgi:hypothetical protein